MSKLNILVLGMFLAACNSGQTNKNTTDTIATSSAVPQLEEVFADSAYQITGVAVAKDGRLFTNYPYWGEKHAYSVVEVVNGEPVPYPDTTWNSFKKGEDGQNKFVCVQSVVTDDQGFLWVVDAAGINLGPVYQGANKVLKINLATNKIDRIYHFPESVAGKDSYLNDIRIDNVNGYAYMTTSANGGIVVLNTKTGDSRLVLHDHYSVLAEKGYHFEMNGRTMVVNSDGIALTADQQWLYYKPLTDDKLYRINTDLLRNFKTSKKTLQDSVKDLGKFVTTDGMILDKEGNLYMGDLEKSAIVKITPDLQMHYIAQDKKQLLWPDSYSISDDGYLYISCSQITYPPTLPYKIFRLKI
ncbi:L-dopachrome tautomerase-related protein [Chitinophaga sancti]|uniref:L-dopachrome tautomerase-related protein n=1 Tax=Chitinophaga sancti TaxID=1004 RepID=UPI002A755209|nr:L-dopachrome tautomerase-related protein [Chitinophaga sancti]WPQ66383.1 L-dopachrome tautomerase-related protein [Chitinophaga sancti]